MVLNLTIIPRRGHKNESNNRKRYLKQQYCHQDGVRISILTVNDT